MAIWSYKHLMPKHFGVTWPWPGPFSINFKGSCPDWPWKRVSNLKQVTVLQLSAFNTPFDWPVCFTHTHTDAQSDENSAEHPKMSDHMTLIMPLYLTPIFVHWVKIKHGFNTGCPDLKEPTWITTEPGTQPGITNGRSHTVLFMNFYLEYIAQTPPHPPTTPPQT